MVKYSPQAEVKGLTLSCPSCIFVVNSDKTLLRRIIENVVSNAIHYTEQNHVELACESRDGMVDIKVSDTGIGFPQEASEDLFKEFYQIYNLARDPNQRHGMGLAMVKHIANLLGHRIDVASSPGNGTSFAVEVPLGKELQNCTTAQPSIYDQVSHPYTASVLIIDNEPIVLDAIKVRLEIDGYTVQTAADSHEAMARLNPEEPPPHVIVSDFRLPGINGIELVKRIRQTVGKDVPAIIMTGDVSVKITDQLNVPRIQKAFSTFSGIIP